VRSRCAAKDGRIHTDTPTKLITALIYFNDQWEASGGRLRLLRSPTDLDDMIGEVAPDLGTMIVFRRSDKSFHGHEPYKGVRRYVMINWMTSDFAARRELFRHRVSARAKLALKLLKPQRAAKTGGARG
jgi:SM-20-related protein